MIEYETMSAAHEESKRTTRKKIRKVFSRRVYKLILRL